MKFGLDLINDINNSKIEKGNASFWWIGQLGYIVKLSSTVIYFDPFLSDLPGRNVKSLLKPEEVTNADLIFGSHDHIDHIDRNVWNTLSKSSPKAKFVVPRLLIDDLSKDLNIPRERFIGLDDDLTVNYNGLELGAIPAAHEFLDYDEPNGSHPYLGFIVYGDGVRIYHSGDTCIHEGMYEKLRRWGEFDLMFLPINGRDGVRLRNNLIGNMTYQEAVDLAGTMNPGLVVPGHYEMFSDNSEDPELFRNYLQVKYPSLKCWIGEHGEGISIK